MAQAYNQFSPLNALAYVQEQGEMGRARGQQNQLAQLASQSYAANTPEQRQQLLTSMAVVNPAAAQAQQQQFQGNEDRQRKLAYGAATYLKGALDTKNPAAIAGAWRSVRPGLINAGIGTEADYAQEWQPEYEQMLHQVLASSSNGGAAQTNQNKVVGGALVTPDGQVVYEAPVDGKIVDIPDGMGGKVQMVYNPRTNALSPLPQPGASGQGAAPGGSYTTSDGQPYRLGGDLSPEQIATAQADMQAGATLSNVQLPERNSGPRLGYTPPAQASTYSTLSPDEVAALGLPVGTIAQRSPTGQVQIINKPRDLPTGGQVIDNGDGTTTYIPAGKITEGERNASGFYQRMVSANEEMRRLEGGGFDPANRRDYYTAGGEFLNPLATTEGQQYRQAQDNWLRANLRKESGAAIGVAEMDQERKNYFPIPGDGPEVIAQKMRNRTVTERAMRSAAGGGLPPEEGAAPSASAGPKPGEVQDGYRFRGGNPADPNSWEQI